MTSARRLQARDICLAVLDRGPDERGALLQELCAGDDELRREVERLVADAGGEGSARTRTATQAVTHSAPAWQPPLAGASHSDWKPETIGAFRIIRVVGEGGMGVVYEARQQAPGRTVALKVIKPGLATPEILRRFRQETHALGRLQHPGIAQIYDAGTAETPYGPQPYFAMEFIHGQSLRSHVDGRRLGLPQRLELIAKICDAVHHAHQRGLIHRDLKPSNILVDETGQPKVLDFGVARLTDSDVQATQQTGLGQVIGTLAYMSPEQVLADPLELDTRSDVYALGVMLYELLAGHLPYTVSARIHEAARTIQQEDPKPLSSISRAYRGDIATIAAKALEKDKARRYGSAAALAADIRRYLRNEPISARPASASYQLQKFARRHRALVAGIAAVIVALAIGIVATTREAIRARRAERAAVAAEETTAAINEFLRHDVLAQASAMKQARGGLKPDPDLKVRTALERAAASIGGRFQARPLVEASLRHTIGETYRGLGLYPEAIAQLESAYALRRASLGDEHPETLETMHMHGHVLWLQAKYADAERLFAAVLAARTRVQGEAHPDTLLTMNSLALLHASRGEYGRAEPLLVKFLDATRRQRGAHHQETAHAQNDLASLYKAQGNYRAAEPLYLESLQTRERVLGSEAPETLASLNDLAHLYRLQARHAEAEPLYVKSLALKRKVFGDGHSETAITAGNLGNLYANQGDYAKAEPLLVESMETRRRIWGDNHPDTATGINNVATLYSALSRRTEAERLYAEALAIRRRTLGSEHLLTMQSVANLAVEYRVGGKYSLAEAMLTEALGTTRRVYGGDHPETLRQARSLASVYRVQQKYALAEPLAMSTLEAYRRTLGADHPDTAAVEEEVAMLRLAQGRLDDAQRHASQALAVRRARLLPTHANLLRTMALVGRIHLERQEYPAAERLLREARDGYAKAATNAWLPALADSLLGRALAGQEKYAEAESLLASAWQRLQRHKADMPSENQLLYEEASKALAAVKQGARRRG